MQLEQEQLEQEQESVLLEQDSVLLEQEQLEQVQFCWPKAADKGKDDSRDIYYYYYLRSYYL